MNNGEPAKGQWDYRLGPLFNHSRRFNRCHSEVLETDGPLNVLHFGMFPGCLRRQAALLEQKCRAQPDDNHRIPPDMAHSLLLHLRDETLPRQDHLSGLSASCRQSQEDIADQVVGVPSVPDVLWRNLTLSILQAEWGFRGVSERNLVNKISGQNYPRLLHAISVLINIQELPCPQRQKQH